MATYFISRHTNSYVLYCGDERIGEYRTEGQAHHEMRKRQDAEAAPLAWSLETETPEQRTARLAAIDELFELTEKADR